MGLLDRWRRREHDGGDGSDAGADDGAPGAAPEPTSHDLAVARVLAGRADGEHGLPRDGQWVWPAWLEVVAGAGESATSGRCTSLGVVGGRVEATVDPRGLIAPWGRRWSLDWWVGADDRWHLPSRDVAVRQHLIESVPVVETAMRVPNGDARQRVSTVAGRPDLVIVEIENDSSVPFAVALAVRPYDPEGMGRVGSIRLEGTTVLVDGLPAIHLPRRPGVSAGSTAATGDCAVEVLAGRARPDEAVDVLDPDGLATAAFVFPVAHRQVLRLALTLGPPSASVGIDAVADTAGLPTHQAVARGWRAHLERGLRVDLPDARVVEAVTACRARLLTCPAPDALAGVTEALALVSAHRWGLHAEASGLAAPGPVDDASELTPVVRLPLDAASGGGAALWAAAEAWRLGGDPRVLDAVAERTPEVASALRERMWMPGRAATEGRGLPQGSVPDALWWLRAVATVSEVLGWEGRPDPADLGALATALRTALRASLDAAAIRLGVPAVPGWPEGPVEPMSVGGLVALTAGNPLGVVGSEVATVAATALGLVDADASRGSLPSDRPAEAFHLALALMVTDPGAGWRRAMAALDLASTTWTWPERLEPGTDRAAAGRGDDPRAAAAFLLAVREMLVSDSVPGRLTLLRHLPTGWAGTGLEVHDAPTRHGLVSYAVRWHGERPAVLWECGSDDVELTAPGLDPDWVGRGSAGEALLAPWPGDLPSGGS